MGNSKSSPVKSKKMTPVPNLRGRESKPKPLPLAEDTTPAKEFHVDVPEQPIVDTASEDDSDYEEEEEDEEWEERMRILDDARRLHKVATFFLHPEKPVEVDATASARCFFDRPSADERVSFEDAEEARRIQEDMAALKQLAVDYMHPEKPVVGNGSTARCYFDRLSAPEPEDFDYAEERAEILAELQQLKKLAVDFAHPELPMGSTSVNVGRNFFSRPSAPDMEEEEERARILEDARALKELAVDYMHPEVPVVTTDTTACGRNYFSRASAPEQESPEDADERVRVLAEAKALKQLAVDYMHPELPVETTDATVFGRNFFMRPSAPEQESFEEAEERAQVMADLEALKKNAVAYMHPELPVTSSDANMYGRNYFSRPSAPDQESVEEAEERARVLEEAMALKKLAVDFMHPEIPIATTDATACGRNYFSRPSAPEQESIEEMEARQQALEDAAALKKLAVDFMHPELPVTTTDATAFGRNYFSRPSAPEQESRAEDLEHHKILEEAEALKSLAIGHLHPELPVVSADANMFGRNFFSRPSAPEQVSYEDMKEYNKVLQDMTSLKKLAVDFMHPEMGVTTSDAMATARNYYGRASATEQESPEDAEERALIMAELQALKKLAVDYMHPELSVVTTDGTACGRNYFDRPSAPLHAQCIHTFAPHEDDLHHDDGHHAHLDHFGMDEDMDHIFDDMRQSFVAPTSKAAAGDHEDDEEGNLSRSPSSIMLFSGEPIYD